MEAERKQIDYLKQFFNVERIIGKGAFGQVLVTSPIQNQQHTSPLRTTTAIIQTQSPTPPESASSISRTSTFSNNCNNTTIITTTSTTTPANNLRYYNNNDGKEGVRFAVKCVLPVVKPQRLASELRYLRDLGGKCNVVQLHTAQLHKGSLYIVMELIDHERFSKLVAEMDYDEIVMYIKNLLIALQHVHSHNIMHRDIKPANFLYNRQHRKFLLVDFGLATQLRQRPVAVNLESGFVSAVTINPPTGGNAPPTTPTRRLIGIPTTPTSLITSSPRTPNNTTRQLSLGSKLFPDSEQHRHKVISNSPYVDPKHVMMSPAKRMNFGSPLNQNISTKRHLPNATNDSIQMLKKLRVSNNDEHREPVKLTVGAYESPITTNDGLGRQQVNQDNHKFSTPKIPRHPRCNCRGKPRACPSCLSKPEANAPKSGTPGFKAPEILLRYPNQTTAIDVWSAGVILFCLLAGHSPLFRNVDDATSLCEIITIFGSRVIIEVAKQLGIRLNMSPEREGQNLTQICQKIRSLKTETGRSVEIPDQAYDLLARMLDPNPLTRITAADALHHPWLKQ